MLPAAPLYTNGSLSGRLSPGSPASSRLSPRDLRSQYQHSAQPTSDSPVSSISSRSNLYNTSDQYSPNGGADSIYANPATRQPSSRPLGAAAPYNGVYDDVMQSPGNVDLNRNSSFGHRSRNSEHTQQYRPVDSVLRPYSPTHAAPSPLSSGTNAHISQQSYRPPSDAQLPPPAALVTPSDSFYC